jgi:3-oxoacyl-[acyl-carrier-protein] synthase III
MRLLQMPEAQRMQKLKENVKLICIKKEVNGMIEELLKENGTDKTDIKYLIHSAATVIINNY